MICGIILADNDETLYYVSEFQGLIKFDLVNWKVTNLVEEVDGSKMTALNGLAID